MFIFGGLVPALAVVMLVVAFTSEEIVIDNESFKYRCAIFGIGRKHIYKLKDTTIRKRKSSSLFNSFFFSFPGWFKARFIIEYNSKKKHIGGDISKEGVRLIADLFRNRKLMD